TRRFRLFLFFSFPAFFFSIAATLAATLAATIFAFWRTFHQSRRSRACSTNCHDIILAVALAQVGMIANTHPAQDSIG
ncbi:MAG: hypothetical protein IBX52_05480, partial [Bacterioplanes sp.]|nr:hypothetical protein [Bacterioplanes sp.]